jgi:sugar phosphate isomerase/epimerase
MPVPVALQLYSLREEAKKGFTQMVQKVADMGYTGVEPSSFPGTTAQDAGKMFADLGLAVPSAHLPLPVGDKQNEIIDAMAALGSQRIISGKGSADFATMDKIKETCDLFNLAAANASSAGLQFGVHNHWWEFGRVEGRYVYQVMQEYLEPDIFFQIDTYWVQTAGVDPSIVVRELGARAPILHIKDGPCVKELPMTAVGDGNLDFHSILRAGGNNTEWLIVEIDRCATDMVEAVQRSLQYLVANGLGIGK